MQTPRKVRVVFVLNDFIIGGVQRLYLELFKELNQPNYEIHLITCMELSGRADFYGSIPSYVTVHRLSFCSLFDVRALHALARLLASLRPDAVLASLFFSTTVTRLASLTAEYPIIAIEQNVNDWKNWSQVMVDRLLSFRSPVIVAASKTVAAFSARQSGIPSRKYQVIHNGIDTKGLAARAAAADTNSLRTQLGLGAEDIVYVNVARLTAQKNHPMLIDAFAPFARTHPRHRLVLVGEGNQREALEAQVKRLGLNGVVFVGAQQDVVPYYALASCFVSSSFIEGFGIAHAEALACGLPVLSTRTAGPDEMIEEGVNGYFMETTVDGILAGLERMADEGVRASKTEIQSSVLRFDSSTIAKQYDRIIKHTIAAKKNVAS